MKRIAVVVMMRLGSQRVPNKLLQTIGDKPLVTWSLSRIKEACEATNTRIFAGISKKEQELVEIVKYLDIPVFTRSDVSVGGENIGEIYDKEFVRTLQFHQIEYLVMISACRPFLPVETTIDFLNKVRDHAEINETVLGVFRKRMAIYDMHGNVIVGGFLNTKALPVVLVPAHCYYGYPTSVVGSERMSRWDSFYIVPESLATTVDIDTEDDLFVAKALAERFK